MKYTCLLILILLAVFRSHGQTGHGPECEKLTTILATMITWKTTQSPPLPVQLPARKRTIVHSMLLGKYRLYYANTVLLTGDVKSEWGIDDDGKCSFNVFFGPYPASSIDAEGGRARGQWLKTPVTTARVTDLSFIHSSL